jgi:hypothetical protein
MTVAQLIAALENFNADSPVIVSGLLDDGEVKGIYSQYGNVYLQDFELGTNPIS